MAEPLLVADIGGTNARFACAETREGRIVVRDVQRLRAEDFETVEDATDAYLEAIADAPARACFAAAGVVRGGNVSFTNSQWSLHTDEVRRRLGLEAFLVVNDFYAMAAGVSHLSGDAFVEVKGGTPETGAPRLVIGPGTGLGQALIVPSDGGEIIISTEGGHVSFAPRTDEEYEVLKFIAREHPRVSVERLLSGRGLVNIHRALCSAEGVLLDTLRADEITAAAAAQDGRRPIAGKAVEMFCAVLGAVAADAVLATGARGGVVLGGGILPRIRDLFLASAFVERFLDKGRMTGYVEAVPVRLIVRDEAALYGAAAVLSEDGRP